MIIKKATPWKGVAFDEFMLDVFPVLHLQIFHFQLRGKGLLVVAFACGFVERIG